MVHASDSHANLFACELPTPTRCVCMEVVWGREGASSLRVINNYGINWIMKFCYFTDVSFIFVYIDE